MMVAWVVDASPTRANRITQNRDNLKNNRRHDLRGLDGSECDLEFSDIIRFIMTFSSSQVGVQLDLGKDRFFVH